MTGVAEAVAPVSCVGVSSLPEPEFWASLDSIIGPSLIMTYGAIGDPIMGRLCPLMNSALAIWTDLTAALASTGVDEASALDDAPELLKTGAAFFSGDQILTEVT